MHLHDQEKLTVHVVIFGDLLLGCAGLCCRGVCLQAIDVNMMPKTLGLFMQSWLPAKASWPQD